jgi:hypothetical protein
MNASHRARLNIKRRLRAKLRSLSSRGPGITLTRDEHKAMVRQDKIDHAEEYALSHADDWMDFEAANWRLTDADPDEDDDEALGPLLPVIDGLDPILKCSGPNGSEVISSSYADFHHWESRLGSQRKKYGQSGARLDKSQALFDELLAVVDGDKSVLIVDAIRKRDGDAA